MSGDSFDTRLEHLGPVVPVAGGAIDVPVPRELGVGASVALRYVLYEAEDGFFFSFVGEDLTTLPAPVLAWIWARRMVVHWQLRQDLEAYLARRSPRPDPPAQ